MTIDQVHEIVRGANPVPDLDVLAPLAMPFLADRASGGEVSTDQIDVGMPEPETPRLRRGLLLGAATAGLVVIVGLALAFFSGDSTEVPGGDSRVLQLTFDGEQCSFEGPSKLSAGDVEFVFHNESSQATFAWFGGLDEGKTTQDIIDYNVDGGSGAPSWTVGVWSEIRVEPNESSVPRMLTVVPGLHNFTCGTWTPYQGYNGGELTVTP